jgi:hypothetical protein
MWFPLFDSSREHFDIAPLWVRLSVLPLDCWSPRIFKDISNSMGEFLEVNMSSENTGEMLVAQIWFRIDAREELA